MHCWWILQHNLLMNKMSPLTSNASASVDDISEDHSDIPAFLIPDCCYVSLEQASSYWSHDKLTNQSNIKHKAAAHKNLSTEDKKLSTYTTKGHSCSEIVDPPQYPHIWRYIFSTHTKGECMFNYGGLLRRVLYIYYGAGAMEGIFHSTHTLSSQ